MKCQALIYAPYVIGDYFSPSGYFPLSRNQCHISPLSLSFSVYPVYKLSFKSEVSN